MIATRVVFDDGRHVPFDQMTEGWYLAITQAGIATSVWWCHHRTPGQHGWHDRDSDPIAVVISGPYDTSKECTNALLEYRKSKAVVAQPQVAAELQTADIYEFSAVPPAREGKYMWRRDSACNPIECDVSVQTIGAEKLMCCEIWETWIPCSMMPGEWAEVPKAVAPPTDAMNWGNVCKAVKDMYDMAHPHDEVVVNMGGKTGHLKKIIIGQEGFVLLKCEEYQP